MTSHFFLFPTIHSFCYPHGVYWGIFNKTNYSLTDGIWSLQLGAERWLLRWPKNWWWCVDDLLFPLLFRLWVEKELFFRTSPRSLGISFFSVVSINCFFALSLFLCNGLTLHLRKTSRMVPCAVTELLQEILSIRPCKFQELVTFGTKRELPHWFFAPNSNTPRFWHL